ncbi:glycine/betaine ABC transporter ATP-binding protein, partial [Streptomyces sp. NPDC058375]
SERGPAVRPEATVYEAIEAVSRSGDPVARVMDGGRLVGVVDHACLLDVVAGTSGPGTNGAAETATPAAAAPGAPDAPDGSREVTA